MKLAGTYAVLMVSGMILDRGAMTGQQAGAKAVNEVVDYGEGDPPITRP